MWSICSLSYHLKTRHVCIWSSYVVLWNGKQNMFYVLFLTMGPRGSYKVVPCSIDPTFSQNVHCPLRYLRSLTLITFTIVSWELTIITIRVSITQKTHAHFILWNKESLSPSLKTFLMMINNNSNNKQRLCTPWESWKTSSQCSCHLSSFKTKKVVIPFSNKHGISRSQSHRTVTTQT